MHTAVVSRTHLCVMLWLALLLVLLESCMPRVCSSIALSNAAYASTLHQAMVLQLPLLYQPEVA